jgi:hypothetical protein
MTVYVDKDRKCVAGLVTGLGGGGKSEHLLLDMYK